ncbi:hypothetical protein OS242_08980 [Tumebacillus sp. DT12]|uniref:Uncharacterized protein n=1 Tax=Tumebacillus lacus TaxID=2995335 RepID=A0ABT3X2C3_9BACL|nr:hypothetical protein [Tumebacillus lacus]MCX7570098.1 hypothetical protein [Tumebacillus lacus]
MNYGITASIAALGIVVVAGLYVSLNQAQQAPQATQTKMPVIEYAFALDRDYKNLQELQEESTYIVVAEFLEKKPSRLEGGIVETHNDFQVLKVYKGPKEIENTAITVNETGGIYEGKKYQSPNNKLFDEGVYLLFMHKGDKYYCLGIGAGKYKVKNSKGERVGKFERNAGYLKEKITSYGNMGVKEQVADWTGEQLISEIEKGTD